MTLEAAFRKLHEKLDCLERSLENVLWAVIQGQPEADQGHTLVDHYDAATTDFLGLVKEARAAAEEGQKATRGPLDLTGARQALTTCQDRFNQLSNRLYPDVVSFDRIAALHNLAHERRGEWARWVEGVKDALSQYPQPLFDMGQALFTCWQELSERVSPPFAMRQTTSTGVPTSITREQAGCDASADRGTSADRDA
jgi:hypothetical protein